MPVGAVVAGLVVSVMCPVVSAKITSIHCIEVVPGKVYLIVYVVAELLGLGSESCMLLDVRSPA